MLEPRPTISSSYAAPDDELRLHEMQSAVQDVRVDEPDNGQHDAQPVLHGAGVLSGAVDGFATHYGAHYEGSPLGCTGQPYRSADPTIAASAWRPDGSRAYECGDVLEVCGPGGCAVVTVVDACPGCWWDRETGASTIDLSEAGSALACGTPSSCAVTIRRVR